MTASLEQVFGADGPFARTLSGYEPRSGQLQMAQLVERGILEGMHTIVEAGTGVGKSLAYLVPAIRSGKKVVLSTGTIALQEQLVHKDIPLVEAALGTPVRVTLLKGRSHYLCRQKLELMRSDRLIAPSRSMQRMWEWGARTESGDRAELRFQPPANEWEQLDADADECVGEFCRHFRDCFFFTKRDEAKYADLVVVNHALFFLDLAVGGGLLPAYDVAVLDEAHQCERWATDALTAVALGGDDRPDAAQAASRLRPAVVPSMRSSTRACAAWYRRWRACPATAIRSRPTRTAWPALESLRDAFYRFENWLHANWHGALKRRVENDAEAERRRDLALRARARARGGDRSRRGRRRRRRSRGSSAPTPRAATA